MHGRGKRAFAASVFRVTGTALEMEISGQNYRHRERICRRRSLIVAQKLVGLR